jgi:hypothetical protein
VTRKRGREGRLLPHELLDDAKGKFVPTDNSNVEISNSDGNNTPMPTNTSKNAENNNDRMTLLLPPVIIATGNIAKGATSNLLQKQNKCHCIEKLLNQGITTQWHTHKGSFFIPTNHCYKQTIVADHIKICPQGLALWKEAAILLTGWSQFGCPTRAGWDWTIEEMQAAIDCGPHQSVLQPEAIQHFDEEIWD